VPGLIDIHVHFREPGQEWKETIETGSKSAVAGGFTAVSCMPNTNPINDSASVTELILERAAKANLCRVYPIGAITMGSKGKSLAPMMELTEAGCVAFSDDGWPVSNAQMMRRALEYSSMFERVLTVHEEDTSLSNHFAMNESALSIKLGLQGMPDAAENVMIARDIELARLTGGYVHFCHVSTARGVELIRRAKNDGISVTAETTPHYLVATEDLVSDFDTNAKMSMPLRGAEDVEALRIGVKDGTIDCIASDHAPHENDSKFVEFDKASFGTIGLQTTLPLVMQCVREKAFSLERGIEALTSSPRKCFKLEEHSLKEGQVADVVVIDPERVETATKEFFQSKSKNSMFLDWQLQGLADYTFVSGRQVYSAK
ncbi:UNVERIFIED_CONTAM: hypothetical protein GTU68_056762, partial [Idotea baltica]|nr:hypothetical protein [Idotea baltica]